MNWTTNSGSCRDYFSAPVCTDEIADLAYREFAGRREELGADFGRFLEARAWLAPFRSEDAESGPLSR